MRQLGAIEVLVTARQPCACPRTRRSWQPDGTCARCGSVVLEGDLMAAIRAVLVADPRCLVWRNNVGVAQVEYGRRGRLSALLAWVRGPRTAPPPEPPDLRPLVYGLCPGSADLIGCFGPRFLAVEVKTPAGRLSPEQRDFGRWLAQRDCVYAVCRTEADATELLRWLRGDGERPDFVLDPTGAR